MYRHSKVAVVFITMLGSVSVVAALFLAVGVPIIGLSIALGIALGVLH